MCSERVLMEMLDCNLLFRWFVGRTTRHVGCQLSLKQRKRLEQIFGGLKTTGLMRKLRPRGRALLQWVFTLALSA